MIDDPSLVFGVERGFDGAGGRMIRICVSWTEEQTLAVEARLWAVDAAYLGR